MLINKAYKFRIYLTKEQKELIHKTFGCNRFLYNKLLSLKKEDDSLSRFDMIKLIPTLKEQYSFLGEIDGCSLRCSVFDLDTAFNRFYKKIGGYPRYRKYEAKSSYRTNLITSEYRGKVYENIKIDLNNKILTLPKIGNVSIRGYRKLKEFPGKIINVRVSREGNKYYASICVSERVEVTTHKTMKIVGIDLGVKSLVITSDNEYYGNPKYSSKYESKIKGLQKWLSRQEKGSENYKKTLIKLAEVYRKLKNARKKITEEIVSKIIKYNDVIVTESLDIKRMTNRDKNRKNLRKEILNATFGNIIRTLEYKSKWLDKKLIKVSPYYKSTQICNQCNSVDKSMKDLNKREYRCIKCGNVIERDLNSSLNIMYEGVRLLVEGNRING